MQNSTKKIKKSEIQVFNREKSLAIFDEKIKIRERATTSNLVQIPWNFVEGFCISGNPNKGNSVISKPDQTEPLYCLRIPPIFACLSHGFYFDRARG